MDKDRETSLSVVAKALSTVVAPQDSGSEPPADRCQEIRSASNLEERLQNWGSD